MLTPEARERRRVRTPVLVATGSAWLVLLGSELLHSGSDRRSVVAGLGAGAALQPGPPSTTVLPSQVHVHQLLGGGAPPEGSLVTLPGFLAAWGLMLTAMMAPLLVPALRHARDRSLRRRRWRAMCLTTVGYAASWAAAGILLLVLAAAPGALTERTGARFALGLAVALAWQVSPVKQRCLNRHHAHPPVAAFGWEADRDALRLGGTHAASCLGSCWALMLLPLLAPTWHLGVMAVVTAWMWAERLEVPARPTWGVRLPLRAVRLVASTAWVPGRRPVWTGGAGGS
ncbi:MAG TPA: DUF2182 domain-containing protein [Ornithinibacter sp.]|nr:DUF2182 domain-containing protein [Ornithinibacter sp.]